MYAIVEAMGEQVKVSEGERVVVPYINETEGKEIELNKVLLLSDEQEIKVGQPYIENAKILCKIVGEKQGKKVIVFSFKRRKRYHRKKGHRELYTILEVLKISVNK